MATGDLNKNDASEIKEGAEKALENKADKKDSGKGGKGFPKGAFIAIVVLALAVIGLVAFIIGDKTGKKKSDDNTTKVDNVTEDTLDKTTEKTDSTDTTAASSEKTSTEATTEKVEKKDDPLLSSKSPVYLKLDNSGYWGDGSSFTCQYNVNIVNNSGKAIENWEVVFTGFGKDSKLGDNWCGSYKLEDGTLSVKPADFNNKIDDKNETNFGFQIVLTSEAEAKNATKDVKLFINGEEYDAAAAVSGDKTEDGGKEDKTEDGGKEDKTDSGKTPFEIHGKLKLDGVDIVDKNGDKFQLKGVSTHGLAWFPDYVNKDAFRSIRDDWGANLIRLAMYTDENGGYCAGGDKDKLKQLVKDGVDYATELGMYVIVDWHILHDLTPMKYKDEAIAFFTEMSELYKDHDNVIFEICNEPNGGTSWSEVKEYAEEVIPVIRKNCPDAIIIVGTPNWSQDADAASNDQIKGYDNIMYAVHFYAATHKEGIRDKVKTARANGAAVFISEFSICDASGDGAIDYDSAADWMDYLNDNDISYAMWNLSNKNEASSLISSGCSKTSGWSKDDMSETGKWLLEQLGK
ncbi:MAG: cellulase family glycosylhydrolase [Eubacterium sp.]|nr:cellulase family glycosylhydrolase [Eubacterium sp.]